MAFDYAAAAATALELIADAGKDVSIRRVAQDYDPVAGETFDRVKDAGTVKAVVLPFASSAIQIFGNADNKLTQALIAGKLRYVLAAASGAPFEPVANDVLVLEGEQFTVRGCVPLSPAGVPVLYKIVAEITPAAPTDEDVEEIDELEAAAEGLDEVVQ